MKNKPHLIQKISEEYQQHPQILGEMGKPAMDSQIEGFNKHLETTLSLPKLFYDFYRLHNGTGGHYNALAGGQVMSLEEIVYWTNNWRTNRRHYEEELKNGKKPCKPNHFLPFMLFQEDFVPISWEREYLGKECVIDTLGKIGGKKAVKGQIVTYDWKFFSYYTIIAPSYALWLEIYFDLLKEGFLFDFQMNEEKYNGFGHQKAQAIQKICGAAYPKYVRENMEELKRKNNWI